MEWGGAPLSQTSRGRGRRRVGGREVAGVGATSHGSGPESPCHKVAEIPTSGCLIKYFVCSFRVAKQNGPLFNFRKKSVSKRPQSGTAIEANARFRDFPAAAGSHFTSTPTFLGSVW